MKIYVCHSTDFDFRSELYIPLQRAFGEEHQLILPHDNKGGDHSKTIIKSSDIVLGEVSYASTGQGIELGWADDLNVPIICIHKSSQKPSSALRHVTHKIISYDDEGDMLDKIAKHLA